LERGTCGGVAGAGAMGWAITMGTAMALMMQPGQVTGDSLGWIMLAAVVTSHLQKSAIFGKITTIVCLIDAAVFPVSLRSWDSTFFHVRRTAREVGEHDQQPAQMVYAVCHQLDPKEVAICHAHESLPLGSRHPQPCLPKSEQYQLVGDPVMPSPADTPMIGNIRQPTEIRSRNRAHGKRMLALVVSRGTSPKDCTPRFDLRHTRPSPGGWVCVNTIPGRTMR